MYQLFLFRIVQSCNYLVIVKAMVNIQIQVEFCVLVSASFNVLNTTVRFLSLVFCTNTRNDSSVLFAIKLNDIAIVPLDSYAFA